MALHAGINPGASDSAVFEPSASDGPGEALPLLRKRFAQFDERQIAAAFEDIRKITPRSLLVTKAGLENAELFNIEAGLLKPEEKLKSYDGLFTDQFVR